MYFLRNNPIWVGFCAQQFPFEGKWLGREKNSNSIGIGYKEEMLIDGSYSKFEKASRGDFKEGDFVGFGLIRLQNLNMECFATCMANSWVILK